MARSGEHYSHGHHESVLRSHRWRSAANSAAYLLPRLQRSDRLLDVGMGPATITVELADLLTEGSVIGLDSAPAAVAAARQLAAQRGTQRLECMVGDVYDLQFPDHTFDVVHAHQVLQHLADPVRALQEMARVTRPGGTIAVRDADYQAMTWWPEVEGLDRWLDLYRRVARENGGEPDAGRRLRSWALQAGLDSVISSATTWCFAEADDVAWWSQTWASRITESDLARQAIGYGFATADQLAELAEGWRVWGAAPDAWFTVLHAEVLATPGS